jgi:superfamily II DNA or RNA helicase
MDPIRLLRAVSQGPHAAALDARLSTRFPELAGLVRGERPPPLTLRDVLYSLPTFRPAVAAAVRTHLDQLAVELAPEPEARRGWPRPGDPRWGAWLAEQGLGWLGAADVSVVNPLAGPRDGHLAAALSAVHPARHHKKLSDQDHLARDVLGPLLERMLAAPRPPPTPRTHPVAARVQARVDAARAAIRGWPAPARSHLGADPATGEVIVTTGHPACGGGRHQARYDGATGELLADSCLHDGPCGSRLAADELLAAWLDSTEAEYLRRAAEAPAWERALADLRELRAPAVRYRVVLARDPLRARVVGPRGEVLRPWEVSAPPDLYDSDPVRLLRALAREPNVELDGARIRVRESDLPANVAVDGDTVTFTTPDVAEYDLVWLPSGDGDLWWARVTPEQRRAARWAGTAFPRAHAEALTERLRAAGLRVELPAALRGRPVPWDGRLEVELAFDGRGLGGRVFTSLPGGGRADVGAGATRARAQVDGEWVEVHRDLLAEERAAEQLVLGLGLERHPDVPGDLHRFRLFALDDVVVLVEALGRHPHVTVTWRTPTRFVTLSPGHLRVSGRPAGDWLSIGAEVDGGELPLGDLLEAVRQGRRSVAVRPGEVVTLAAPLFERLQRLAAVSEPGEGGGVRVGRVHAEALTDELGARLQAAVPEPAEVPLPAGLAATLRDYQAEGFRFLARRAAWAPGAVLADDMGLGKTVQAIALLGHRGGPSLVVAPLSVLAGWRSELARFLPGAAVHVHHGAGRQAALEPGPDGVVVTSWDLLVRDEELFCAVPWRTVVLDEAHAIKNPRTRRAAAAAAVPAGFRVALTGTPMENHLGELWSLLRVVVPGLLPREDLFRARFSGPIEREGGDPERLGRLRALVHPFLLRRTKAQVARELPPRTEVVEHVVLTKGDRTAYDRVRKAAAAKFQGGATYRERFALLAALTKLRQLACDARLVEPTSAGGAKLARLVELLEEARASGQRALVFSEFTSLLDLVEPAVAEAGLVALRLDGSTPAAERKRRVDAFQAGQADVFLLSRKAGGTGLNLTAASVVIQLDPWWNPAVEDQSSDRAHRMGQERPVTVVRLVAKDTLEERVLLLHAAKRELVAGVLDGASAGGSLTPAELAELLREDEDGG